MFHPVPRSWFLISLYNQNSQGSLKKWLTLGLELEIYKKSLEYLVASESEKNVLK